MTLIEQETLQDRDAVTRVTVTPLHRLLVKLPADDLFSFLQSVGLDFSVSSAGSRYQCTLHAEGYFRIYGGSNKSPKAAIADAIARFLVYEGRDYHEILRSMKVRRDAEEDS